MTEQEMLQLALDAGFAVFVSAYGTPDALQSRPIKKDFPWLGAGITIGTSLCVHSGNVYCLHVQIYRMGSHRSAKF